MSENYSKRIIFFGSCIWFLSILFFLYEFFLRIFVGTLASNIISDLSLTTEQFSIISASYFIIYALMQVPVGFLVDKFGVKALLSLAAFIAAFGVFWFGFSHGFVSAIISRMFMGFGSSFAFVSMLVILLNWFDKKYFGFLSGISQFLGSVGPFLAGAPLVLLLNALDNNWRHILFYLGIFGIILGILMALFVKNKPKGQEKRLIFLDYKSSFLEKTKNIFQNSQNWWIILYASMIYVPLPFLAAYWGTSFLQAKGLSLSMAAFIISMLWIGYALGAPILGKSSDKIKRRKIFLVVSALVGIIVSSIMVFLPISNVIFLSILSFMIGFNSAACSLTFPVITENTLEKVHGTALGLNNGAIMMFSAILPSLAGSIIQYSLKIHKRTFASIQFDDFTLALSIIPIIFFIALIISIFFIKETYCRSKVEMHKLSK
jgi:MFS family permease